MALTQVQGGMLAGSTNTTTTIQSNGATAITIDSSQNVGIGTTTPTGKLDINGGILKFTGSNPSNPTDTSVSFYNGAGIGATISSFQFALRTGTSSPSERMRVEANGELSYLCTGLDGDRPNAVGTYKQTNGNSKIRVVADGTAAFQFYSPTGGGSPVGSITPNASSTTYATSSDYRLKENIAPMTGALAKVSQLKPCTYTWKTDGSAGQGFIAHELQEVVPDAVIGEKDAVNEDGSIKPQGIDTSFLVATLTAAIQELKAELDATKAEVAALKAAS